MFFNIILHSLCINELQVKKILPILFIIISQLLICSEKAEGNGSDSTYVADNKFIILPFGFYTSDTSVALGLFSQLKLKDSDNIFGNIIYTFKNQLMMFAVTDYHQGDKIIYNKLKAENYYSESYGTGISSGTRDKYDYRYTMIDIHTDFGQNIRKNTGLFVSINNFFYSPKDGKDSLANIYSTEKYQFANGIGTTLKYSDVNDKLFRDGSFARLSLIYYPALFGNLKDFSIAKFEAGKYISVNESAVSLNFLTRFAIGSPHPEKLSYIGGSEILRGYPERRFIDNNMWALQTQYDFRLYKNTALCAFISTGSVFDEYEGISVKNIKTGYGGGIIQEYKGLIIRIEAATSDEKNIQIIVTGNRAF